MASIRRLYVRKKEGFRQAETRLCNALREVLGNRIEGVAIYHRYDVEGINDADYEQAKVTVFSEPPVDALTDSMPDGDMVLAVEFLPGQYDQRADSAEQCLAILTGKDGIRVRCALHYVLTGHFEDEDRARVLKFLVNPVESREASTAPAQTLDLPIEEPGDVPVITGVTGMDDQRLDEVIARMGLAMRIEKLLLRHYLKKIIVFLIDEDKPLQLIQEVFYELNHNTYHNLNQLDAMK